MGRRSIIVRSSFKHVLGIDYLAKALAQRHGQVHAVECGPIVVLPKGLDEIALRIAPEHSAHAMSSVTFVVLSGALSFGVPMVLALIELLAVHRCAGDCDKRPPGEPFRPTPKPLPACLLPAPGPANHRVRAPMLEET